MKRFTVILFVFSIVSLCFCQQAVYKANSVLICESLNNTSEKWKEFLKGLKLSLEKEKISFSFLENCTENQIHFGNETLTDQDLNPSISEEIEHIIPLIEGENIAIVYRDDQSLLAKILALKLEEEGKKTVFEMGFQTEKTDYRKIVASLLELKKNNLNIDTLVFIGNYREATLFVPFFRIFSPSPKVVGTWRISSTYMFPYRKFMEKLIFYDWYTPFEPLIPHRKFCLIYRKTYKKLPTRYAFLGYSLGLQIATSGSLTFQRKYQLIELRKLPRIAPFCRF